MFSNQNLGTDVRREDITEGLTRTNETTLQPVEESPDLTHVLSRPWETRVQTLLGSTERSQITCRNELCSDQSNHDTGTENCHRLTRTTTISRFTVTVSHIAVGTTETSRLQQTTDEEVNHSENEDRSWLHVDHATNETLGVMQDVDEQPEEHKVGNKEEQRSLVELVTIFRSPWHTQLAVIL
ncbi:penicillin-binding 2, putative [Babesia ovata]|uniref:Penicillin-binding 2, putative n=1 Tax=Babesia ovata TaxID=189622 RepID=A0A2H6KEW7_9APIC|nr:penicillin-binding 2, putative [Babesia ovata]GBE61542.1 penicillin-binding 2, putative [Babesia ovata]